MVIAIINYYTVVFFIFGGFSSAKKSEPHPVIIASETNALV